MKPKYTQSIEKSISKSRCCVDYCESRPRNNSELSFFKFPLPNACFVSWRNSSGFLEKLDAFEAWKKALKMSHATHNMKVCALHFKKDDYVLPDYPAKRRRLKKNAVPTYEVQEERESFGYMGDKIKRCLPEAMQDIINIHIVDPGCFKTPNHTVKSEQKKESLLLNDHDYDVQTPVNNHADETPVIKVETTSDLLDPACTFHYADVDKVKLFSGDNDQTKCNKSTSDVALQVNQDYLDKFTDHIKTNAELNTATGLENFEILNMIVETVKQLSKNKYEALNMLMNTRERVIFTLMKIKHKLSFSFMAILFRCYTNVHCKRIFNEMVLLISSSLKNNDSKLNSRVKKILLKNLAEHEIKGLSETS